MKRKIHVMLLMAFLLLFMGMPIYAAEEISGKEASSKTPFTFSQSSSTNQQGEDTRKEVDAGKEGTASGNLTEANVDERSRDSKLGVDNPKPVTKVTKSEGDEASKEQPSNTEEPKASKDESQPEAKAQDKKEDATEEKIPEADPATDPNKEPLKAPEAPTEGGEASGEETGEKPKESKPQVNPDEDKDLSDLKAEIDAEKDDKKKAELQKEYNEKYLEKVEAAGKGKTDSTIQNRLTDEKDIEKYNIIKKKQKEIEEKNKADKLTQKDIDEYNKLLGEFNPPRELTDEETAIKKDYTSKPYINIDEKESSEEGKAKYAEYKKYKEALDKALDPKENGLTEEEYKDLGVKDLKELKAKFDKLNKEVLDMINSGKDIFPAFTDGDDNPKVDIYAYDFSGSVDLSKPIEGGNYYIPDGTKLDLFVQVGRKNDGSKITFTLTPKKVGEPEGGEVSARDNVIYLNGKEIKLNRVDNPDGTYHYEFETSDNFGVAQLKFTIPAIYGELHEGFNIGIQVGEKTISKNFLITKKGYDENPDTGSIGNTDIENPKKEDAGKTEGSKVTEHTDKLFNIFAILKESNGYIDNVLVNSSNGQALPLAHVKITMTLPQNYDGKFAEYIHKSGLKYEKQEDGKYVLELDTKEFGSNLIEENGKYYLKKADGSKGTELEKANKDELKNALLTGKDGKTYVDEEGKEHKVTTVEVQEGTANDGTEDKEGTTYRLVGKTVQKKNAKGTFEDVCTLNDKNIGEKDGLTYELRGDTLLIYKKDDVKDVYDGHVSNKDDKAEPKVTPTNEGKQVTIKEKEDSTEESYGGTIVENGVFNKDNKYIGQLDANQQGATEAWIDETGKKVNAPINNTTITTSADGKETVTIGEETYEVIKDKTSKIVKLIGKGKVYTLVKNVVFEKNGSDEYYIIDGLSYSDKLSLIDKFGRKMDIGVTENKGKYTFTKDKHDPKTSNGTTLIVGTKDEQIYVDSKNYKVDPTTGYTPIVGKYYYDEKANKFVDLKDEADKIIGDKYYPDLVKALLKRKTIETYTTDDGKTLEVPDKAKKLYGSDKKDDYYKADGKYYAMQSIGEGENQKTIFVSEDEVLTEDSIKKIVQVYKDGSQKLVDVDSIFNAVNQAKFQIKFPGFLAGKKVVYTLKTDIVADYEHINTDGNSERISIYKEDGNHLKANSSKTINKYFTLKNKEEKDYDFFKSHPDALEKNLDYNFFNIFFRDGSDRQRDAYIGKLLDLEEKSTTEEAKAKNKKELDLLAKLRKELRRLTGNETANFKYEKNKLTFVDGDDKAIEVNRTLLWKVGFNNPEGALFPEDSDSEITIEDHNMDNRLVYDEIIINHTREKYKEAEEAAGENFKGNKEYFFLDQIKRIFLGVNPNYKDYRFVPAGKDFMITREDIEKALERNAKSNKLEIRENGTVVATYTFEDKKHFIKKGDVKYEVSYDPNTAQIKIKVFDAFYKQHTATTEDPNHFESPVQKGYQEWLKGVNANFDSITADDVNGFKTAFEGFIKSTYGAQSDCFGVLKQKFDEMIKNINDDTTLTDDDKKAKIDEFKKAFKKELKKLNLAYLDTEKNGGNYKFDDMRFNALRIELEAGQSIGGAMDSTKKKYLGITSVIVPDVDIPFTDEFGDKLTNKDLYLHQEIDKILKDGITKDSTTTNYTKDDLNDEAKFKEIMAEAYKRVNALKDEEGNSKIKDLVTVEKDNEDKLGIEKYTVKRGSKFDYADFAIGEGADKKSLKDEAGHTVNPYYVGDGENYKTAEDNVKELLDAYKGKINESEFKKTKFYQDLINPEIEIGLYYMHALGYNRAKFANKANYKLNKVGQGPGIFGKDDNWKNKVCYPGIGQCIENAGGEDFPAEEGNQTEDEKKMKAEDDFSLSYSPAASNFESENPKFDKTSETGKIDFSNEDDKNKKVDYTVDLTVDKLKTDQKIGGDSTKPIDPKAAAEEAKNYNERGYFVYKNSLIIDFLPEIFRFETGSSMTLTINEKALTDNGANTYEGFDIKDFKAKAKPIYVENVYEYLKTLSGDQYKALDQAIKLAESQGKLDKNGNKHAVLAWLPDFEAPHGSKEPQFKLEIKQLVVDKKQFKEYEAHKYSGEKFTNHAVFDIFYADHPITITDGHKGNVDKTMRIYDEEGNIVNKDKAEEWFRGFVELKFGDQYDYKIKYKHVKPGYVDINSSNRDKEAEFVDFFATKDKNNGFRPVLRELLDLKDGFYAEYSLDGETFLTKEEIQSKIANKEITLGDILGVKIKNERGFEINKEVEFVLPMMIPNLDAKVENGKVYYIGQDGKRVELGDAKKFFKLDQLKSSDEKDDMFATNTVDGSNTVTVYLEKERFIRVFKEFLDANGEKLKNLDNLEAKFDIYQIIEENGVKKRVKVGELVANKANDFTDMVDHLPIFKKTTTIDENGNVKVIEVKYDYELKEVPMDGFEGKVWKLDDSDGLGFVWQAKNTEKPEKPEEPHNPPEEPKNPPEEPETPPETPEKPEKPEKPEYPNKEDVPEKPETGKVDQGKDHPKTPDKSHGKNNLPKTGLVEDLSLLYLSGLAFVLLLFLRRKKFAR